MRLEREISETQRWLGELAVLKNRGTIAIYANNGGNTFVLDVRPNMVLNTRFQFLLLYTHIAAVSSTSRPTRISRGSR